MFNKLLPNSYFTDLVLTFTVSGFLTKGRWEGVKEGGREEAKKESKNEGKKEGTNILLIYILCKYI